MRYYCNIYTICLYLPPELGGNMVKISLIEAENCSVRGKFRPTCSNRHLAGMPRAWSPSNCSSDQYDKPHLLFPIFFICLVEQLHYRSVFV